jgi:hypothetical protein
VADLRLPHVRPQAHRVFDSAVDGEQPHPAGAIVRGGRLRRPLYRVEQMCPIQWHHHQEPSTNSMPAVRISARASAAEPGATAAVRSTSTLVVKPARVASSAVRRTH